jgi:uncharacterized protein YndB with AHSA1/START domain
MNTTKPAFELEFTRVIDAPRARIYKAWTNPEQMTKWFAPKPYQLAVNRIDLRTGGTFDMAMRGPNGEDFPFTGTYREVVPPSKLVWSGEFPGDPKDNMLTVVTFEEEGSKTKLHVRQSFNVMTAAVKHATAGAKQGWTMTLDQMTEFVTLGKA